MAKKREMQIARQPWGPRVLLLLERHALPVSLALVLIASLRIVSTYTVFTHVADEPATIACGMEYLDKKLYQYEHQHPPLARIMAAVGPYLSGSHSLGNVRMSEEGVAILYYGDRYQRSLALARLGILPFFWIACWVVYYWGRRYFGKAVAVIALLLFTLLPPVLAHSGFATTDMALAAWLGAAFLTVLVWAERPTLLNSLLFGGATALAVLSKFSALAFFPAAVLIALIWQVLAERPSLSQSAAFIRQRILPLLLAVLTGALVIWAGYRFSFGQVDFANFRLPAPELYHGIQQLIAHNRMGHSAYLLGEFSSSGWWYYYGVVLLVKTPLAFLLLLLLGVVISIRQRRNSAFRRPLAFALAILLVGCTSRINIGVRHVLPVYIAFSIVAAIAAIELVRISQTAKWASWTLGVLVLWMVAAGALKHPDYVAYFNELAGEEPERILVDSDLDWGQDLGRLSRRLREVGAREVAFTSFVLADMEGRHGFPPVKAVNPIEPNAEWIAVSTTAWKLHRQELSRRHPNAVFWLDRIKPDERVGAILLWHFPAIEKQP